MVGAFHPIGCSDEVARDIYSHLEPPFEELFDEAEEHAIAVLYEAWQIMLDTDQRTYNKVKILGKTSRILNANFQIIIPPAKTKF